MSWNRSPVAILVAVLASVGTAPASGVEPPDEYAVVGGAAGVLDGERVSLGGLEARFEPFGLPLAGRRLPLVPALGLTVADDGGTYAYASFRLDPVAAVAALDGETASGRAAAGRRWRIVAFTGLGHYRAGEGGRELGGPLEFRSGLELSLRTGSRSRLGLSFDHLSNAGIYERNGGSESLVLVWSWAALSR